jgi:hypothetical protein
MQIQFLGAAGEVTGSKYLIHTSLEESSCKFLVDYGMFQGAREADEKNQKLLPLHPEEISFLVLTHAHIDHCGLIPRLCAEGFKGPIYCTTTTAKLLEIMLLDSAHIQVSDFERAERKNKLGKWRGDMPVLLYDTKQAIESLNQVKAIPYAKKFSPTPGIEVTFEEAGHILGSSIAVIDIKEKNEANKKTSVSLLLANNKLLAQNGKIETILSELDNSSGTIAFRARFSNPNNLLKHGSSAKVVLPVAVKNAIIIPQKTTFEVQDKLYVFVVDANNKVAQREITIASRMPNLYVVASGLTANDKIIYEGIQTAKEGDKIITDFVHMKHVISQIKSNNNVQ